jgi:Transposase domain (DUF772)
MIRMLIVGYIFGIRSEQQICREVQVNLAYRWFCGLDLEDPIPDHSVFSRARNERFRESDVLRRVFERVVASCIAAGLVDGECFAVDASLIEADGNRQRSIPGKDWDRERDPDRASRAVKEYLATLDDGAFGAASEVRLCRSSSLAPTMRLEWRRGPTGAVAPGRSSGGSCARCGSCLLAVSRRAVASSISHLDFRFRGRSRARVRLRSAA